MNFVSEVERVVRDVVNMLVEKNRRYGNSALEPVRVFSKADVVEQLKVRIDDKLSRVQSAPTDDDEDVVLDLIGYFILYRIAMQQKEREESDRKGGR
jgi:hypothetical protein